MAPGGLVYHVLNRAVARPPLFQKRADYEAFERVLALAVEHHPLRVLAYCLMPNHWHMVLWPPNHQMVPVTVTASASDLCSAAPVCKITSVSSNEPVDDDGTTPDWEITGNLTVNLRAERLGSGSGRVYTIIVACTDASKNSATKAVTVTVPHDQGKN